MGENLFKRILYSAGLLCGGAARVKEKLYKSSMSDKKTGPMVIDEGLEAEIEKIDAEIEEI
jgi:hypothetical protein